MKLSLLLKMDKPLTKIIQTLIDAQKISREYYDPFETDPGARYFYIQDITGIILEIFQEDASAEIKSCVNCFKSELYNCLNTSVISSYTTSFIKRLSILSDDDMISKIMTVYELIVGDSSYDDFWSSSNSYELLNKEKSYFIYTELKKCYSDIETFKEKFSFFRSSLELYGDILEPRSFSWTNFSNFVSRYKDREEDQKSLNIKIEKILTRNHKDIELKRLNLIGLMKR